MRGIDLAVWLASGRNPNLFRSGSDLSIPYRCSRQATGLTNNHGLSRDGATNGPGRRLAVSLKQDDWPGTSLLVNPNTRWSSFMFLGLQKDPA